MERKIEDTVNYLQFTNCALDTAKQIEELQDRPPR